ncbi:MAG: hypothetical protein IAI49_07010 [Candidatus Eremiobacteraeota bacterium]|nr:hypothetical protein [Candidatus Eremiobacteraeota bacterium]
MRRHALCVVLVLSSLALLRAPALADVLPSADTIRAHVRAAEGVAPASYRAKPP